jgi:hypothetical protein
MGHSTPKLPPIFKIYDSQSLKRKTLIEDLALVQPLDSFMWWEMFLYVKTEMFIKASFLYSSFVFFLNDIWLLSFLLWKAVCWKEGGTCYGGSTRGTLKLT